MHPASAAADLVGWFGEESQFGFCVERLAGEENIDAPACVASYRLAMLSEKGAPDRGMKSDFERSIVFFVDLQSNIRW